MADLLCYRCGTSLDALSLPLSRLDECPSCFVYVHCCRMCRFFDSAVAEQCTEDDADEVKDKKGSNFCDYFKPGTALFDPAPVAAESKSRDALGALFGDGSKADEDSPGPDAASDAEDLFR